MRADFIGSEVKLKTSEEYDSTLEITPADIGEIIDTMEDDGLLYVIAFQELTDSEGVTPLVFKAWGDFTFIDGPNN